jgi:basic amino acid/polyamine antiporter, APA family
VNGRTAPLITALSIVSLVGIIHPIMMMGTRVLFAVVRDQRPTSRLTYVNPGGTPVVALVAVTLAGTALLLRGTFDRLFAMVAIFASCNYMSAVLSLIVLRRREPQAPRPFRAWGYPWGVWIVFVVSISQGMLFDIGYADGIVPVLAVPEASVPDGVRAG